MSYRELRVTKQAVVARQSNSCRQIIDLQLEPDPNGMITAELEGGTQVRINCQSRKIAIEGPTQPQITRTYDVGHPDMSGKKTELQLKGIMTSPKTHRVAFSFEGLKHPFPDGQSHLTIRASQGAAQSVTLS